MAWVVSSIPAPQNPTPHLSLRSDPPHPGPCPELSAPYGRIPPPISALIAYPVSSSVFSAHPSIYSVQDPVFCFHPCSGRFFSLPFLLPASPYPLLTAPSPKPPFSLVPPAPLPYSFAPQSRLPSVTVLTTGKVFNLVLGNVLRTFFLSPDGLLCLRGGEGSPAPGAGVCCGVVWCALLRPGRLVCRMQLCRYCFLQAGTAEGPVRPPLV